MDGRLQVLEKVIEALDEDGDISSFERRKRLQKAIYLAQVAGVDLGYRYGWYIKGPYSTALTRDYYALSDLDSDERGSSKRLKREIAAKLTSLKALFDPPEVFPLSRASWLELLASWHYLVNVSRHDDAKAREVMEDKKPELVTHISAAKKKLSEFEML